MKLVDLNIILYAVNTASPHHDRVREWWEASLNESEPVALAWNVLLGFLRLSTNASVFPKPLSVEQACERIDTWLNQPSCRLVVEDDDHWLHLGRLIRQTGAAGNLTTDAHLAALAISHGATLVSCDTDFARFPQLHWVNPLS